MELKDFYIGLDFYLSGKPCRCTDVGTRVIAAIRLNKENPSWYKGPTYAVLEFVIDEDSMMVCHFTKDEYEKTRCRSSNHEL